MSADDIVKYVGVGKKAAEKVASLFEPNKCKIVYKDLKDANDYLKAGRREDYVKTWWAARTYTPAGNRDCAQSP